MAKGTTKPTAAGVRAETLPVLPGEEPWTDAEVEEVRQQLLTSIESLTAEIATAEADLADLMRDFGQGAGDDEADSGAKQYERDHEIALTNSARTMLAEAREALERLDNGTFGVCDSCGGPIGKARLQFAPRVVLCVACKTKQERR
ncbi:TraR/DksA family transcriptional regulator [Kribbia dieselivorans]|uniref:TraR/DksA family transcriptional regulator n=1 Tax=Kribbia dieselivorans TaxID=331526 RepID=UPI0008394437|nr:TraR/DksA family transcriptional regulator [Kribbia dieselivorans]